MGFTDQSKEMVTNLEESSLKVLIISSKYAQRVSSRSTGGARKIDLKKARDSEYRPSDAQYSLT